MIGIVVCDSNEINDLNITYKKIKHNTFTFMETTINNKDVVIVLSGIGMIQSAAATQSLLEKYQNIKTIYNFGAVGATDNLNVYDIVIPKHMYYADVKTPWYKFGQLPEQPQYFKNKIKNKNILNKNIATSMGFIDSKKTITDIQKYINVSIFDMEITAIANVAKNWNVPIGVVKCVSDIINNDDVSKLEHINDRIKNAGKKAFYELIKYI